MADLWLDELVAGRETDIGQGAWAALEGTDAEIGRQELAMAGKRGCGIGDPW